MTRPLIVDESAPCPASPAIFIGRDRELAHLGAGLSRFLIGVILGVAGVGKSALAYAFAQRWQGRKVYVRAIDDDLDALLDEARKQVQGAPIEQLTTTEERLMALAAQMNADDILLIIDDIHQLNDSARVALLAGLAAVLRSGRILTTSRESLMAPSGALFDYVELKLQPFHESTARTLWGALDACYGPSPGFASIWEKTSGLPLLLRRAHRREISEEHPLDETIKALSDDEVTVAGFLALSQVRLDTTAVVSVLPSPRAYTALRRLVMRMIVDTDPPDRHWMSDLFRERVIRSLDADQIRTLHEKLAATLRTGTLELSLRVRETSRHLMAIGRESETAQYLVEHAVPLLREGAAEVLVDGLSAIAEEHRHPAARMVLARALIRLPDLPRAFQEHLRLLESTSDPPPELSASFALVALLTARLELAAQAAERAMRDASDSHARADAVHILALTRTCQGQLDDALRLLEEIDLVTSDPVEKAWIACYRAICLFLAGRNEDAASWLPHARVLLEAPSAGHRAAVPLGSFGVVMARAGDFDTAERLLSRAQRILAQRGDMLAVLHLDACKALARWEKGDQSVAVDELQPIVAAFERCGHVLGAHTARLWLGRVLMTLGRRREGKTLLEEARASGIASLRVAIDEAVADDPVAQLGMTDESPPRSKRGEWIRHCALRALRAATRDQRHESLVLVAEVESAAADGGFKLDLAIAGLARAVMAKLEGRDSEAATAMEAVRSVCAQAKLDADLIPALARGAGELLLVTEASRQTLNAEHLDLRSFPIVIDARSHELRIPGGVVSLRRRAVVRRLLYALARRAGRPVSKDDLTHAMWSRPYNPLIHDESLRSNVHHARSLVAEVDIGIDFDEPGYRLIPPNGFAFVEPLSL